MKRLPDPSPDLIAAHMRAHDADQSSVQVDGTMSRVFRAFPRNVDVSDVLAKVVILNSLYFTNILGVRQVAVAIANSDVDTMLDQGNPEVLMTLAAHEMGGKPRHHFSFATKYAHWHRPDDYPIYDTFVRQQLEGYRRRDQFADFGAADLRTTRFVDIMAQFRRFYELQGCSLRSIDKWLWRQGKGIAPTPPGNKRRLSAK